MKNICVLRGEGERSYGHCVVRLVYIQTQQYSTMYILQGTRGLQCRSADSVLVLVICTIEDMFYLHNLCTLCTSRWSVNVCRYTYCTSYRLPFGKKSETYIISSHLCAFQVLIVLFSTTYTSFDIGRNYESIFFHIQILVHTVQRIYSWVAAAAAIVQKNSREETFLFLSRYTQAHSTMAKNSKGGRQVFLYVCSVVFCSLVPDYQVTFTNSSHFLRGGLNCI